jgi:hypothetical protein
MDWKNWSNRSKVKYANYEFYTECVRNQTPSAIEFLYEQLRDFAERKWSSTWDAGVLDILANRACFDTINALNHADFKYIGLSPMAMGTKIIKGLHSNFIKSKKFVDLSFANEGSYSDDELRDNLELLKKAFDEIDCDCKPVFELDFQGFRDEEIIEKELTKYKSIASLRNKRAKCKLLLIEWFYKNS